MSQHNMQMINCVLKLQHEGLITWPITTIPSQHISKPNHVKYNLQTPWFWIPSLTVFWGLHWIERANYPNGQAQYKVPWHCCIWNYIEYRRFSSRVLPFCENCVITVCGGFCKQVTLMGSAQQKPCHVSYYNHGSHYNIFNIIFFGHDKIRGLPYVHWPVQSAGRRSAH